MKFVSSSGIGIIARVLDKFTVQIGGGLLENTVVDLAQQRVLAPFVEGGPPKLVSQGRTWSTWWLSEDDSHCVVLDTLD